MTDKLDKDSREELIKYRLQRAEETLAEADYNADGGYYNGAVNRLYYACYYAAAALMLSEHLDVSTHKGIKNQLGLHFILKGRLDSKFGTIYSRLFQARQAGDYEDFVFCDKEMYDDLRPEAHRFVEEISKLARIPK